MDRRMYPANEPLPPSDRRAYLECRIRASRKRIYSLRNLGFMFSAEVATLKMKIADWQRELREMDE